MHKLHSSKPVCLAVLLFSTNVVATLACTDTVVTKGEDQVFGNDDGGDREGSANEGEGANQGGIQTDKDSQMGSASNSCDGTDDETCVPCTEHSDCSGTACDKARGRCVPCLVEDSETIGCSDERPFCAIDEDDLTKNQCVECVVHDDCGDGACDTEQRHCVPCLIDDETTIGCVDEQPICKIADNSEDNRCVECVKHSDCDNGACDADENRCVPCLLEDEISIGCDSDGDAPVCVVKEDASENRCVGCLERDDCETGVCDLSHNTCVACLIEDEQQIGCDDEENPLCKVDDDDSKNNTCVACLELSDCNAPSASACDPETNQCTGCSEDSDCDGIEGLGACDDGQCVECTDSETHCSDSTPICYESECRACESHAECDFAGEVCDSETGTCYQSDEVIYIDRDTCETGADGSQERPFCQVNQALNSIANQNSTRIPILVRAGIYDSFIAAGERRTRIIGMPGSLVLGNSENPAIWVRYDSDMIIEGLDVEVGEGQKGIECEGRQGESPKTQPTLVLRDMTVRVDDGGEFGVRSTYNCDLTLADSELFGTTSSGSIGVDLANCSVSSEIRVVGNSISGFFANILADNFFNNIIVEKNALSKGNSGVYIGMSPGTIVLTRNTITSCTIGVYASNITGYVAINANEIISNTFGLQMAVTSGFQMTNNIIAMNGSSSGGAGVVITPNRNLDNSIFHSNTVVFNESIDHEEGCGGVCSLAQNPDEPKRLIVENTIIYGNKPLDLSDYMQPHWCIIGDDSGEQGAASNLLDTPEFVSLDNYDFHLISDSPGVNRGGSYLPSHAPDTDIDGEPRPQGSTIDIGADEVR